MLRKYLLLLFCSACYLIVADAQTTRITGMVVDDQTGQPLVQAEVRTLSEQAGTDAAGQFILSIPTSEDRVSISIAAPGYRTWEQVIVPTQQQVIDLGEIRLTTEESIGQIGAEDLIPTITLSTDEDQSSGAQNISGLLTASRDVFVSAAAYNFGPYRFRIRGYQSNQSSLLLNGAPVNDVESGGLFWSRWGGLNDVLRNQNISIGLDAASFAFGGIGGATMIDTRAAGQRKQLRVSYAASNRAYRHRLMGTWSSGMTPGGWAVSLSASRRWADEGFVDGTFYDAYSYFLSVDKKLGEHHKLNLTAFGSPVKRGRSGAAIAELYDLAGSNYYNSYWGYQNGEKRNSRVVDAHQPMIILRHDVDINPQTRLMTAASYQFGRYGTSALDWFRARDPRPDYYRYLPSFSDAIQAPRLTALMRENESLRQIDWDRLYTVNAFSTGTALDYDEQGNLLGPITGKRAQYIVEERRYDSQTASLNTLFEHNAGEHLTLNGGAGFQYFRNRSFKVLKDLLGADFYVDIDRFADFANPLADQDFIQNDLARPDRAIRQGDVFGYDYFINVGKGDVWLQGDFTFKRVDFFLGGRVGITDTWRDGQVRNGKFPDRSQGESEHAQFTEYGAKAGMTYKIDGRNYLVINGNYQARAPFARYVFQSPRTRNDLAEKLQTEKILSVEGGYLLKAPYAKARAIGYFTRIEDQLYNRSLFLDDPTPGDDAISSGFVNYIMPQVNTQHIGLELAAEVQVVSRLKATAVAAIGQHTYTNRPEADIYVDVNSARFTTGTKYLKNFYVANGPQQAYTFGLNYDGKEFWFANLNLNYFRKVFIDIFPERRTLAAVSYVTDPQYQQQVIEPDSDLWNQIIHQEEMDPAFTLDFFGGKSWKIGDVFLYLNVGVNNILDKRDFVTGGYEQFRFDFEGKDVSRFPNRYFYSYGRNYFISLALRL